ncbi:MAG: type II toxin-antitoxin system RelE/ParE family toxin [Caulobacteraceae bacterium]|nr:type II toxin-antitoxin system RelE/ParE family toxin [Caulobacter sp.]
MAIASFRDARLRAVLDGEAPDRSLPPSLVRVLQRKLEYLASAATLADLRSPPGNRLEALKGDRRGQHSIRVNDQHRLCFTWTDDGVQDLELVDYH